MGGLSGHIAHVFEDPMASVNWVFETLGAIADGRTVLYEKVDGMGLSFTWGSSGPRCARGIKDVACGGMDAAALKAKFDGRVTVRDAFVGAFDTLSMAVCASSKARDVFQNGKVWASFEVVDPACKNVIEYDMRRVVVHRFCWSRVVGDGSVASLEPIQQRASYEELCDVICSDGEPRSRSVASKHGWTLTPSRIVMKCNLAAQAHRALVAAKEAMFPLMIAVSEPVFLVTAREIGGSDSTIAMKAAGYPTTLNRLGSLSVTGKRVRRDAIDAAVARARSISADRRAALAPFAAAVMPYHSPYARDPENQAAEIAASVADRAKCSSDPSLHRQAAMVASLAAAGEFPVIEGAVFETERGVRKLTGWFGPANQVLGAGRYGGRRALRPVPAARE